MHAAGAIIPRHRRTAAAALALALPVLDLNALPRLLDEPLRLADVAHGAAELALLAFLQLLQLAAGLDILLRLLDEFLEPAFQAAAQVLAFVEDAVAVADVLDVLDAPGEVECRAAVLVLALVDDALDFFFVGGFVHVDVDVGGGLGDEECVRAGGLFARADVEE